MIAYISGPMSGYPDHNYPAFFAAEDRLREEGHDVRNPANIGQHEGWTHADYMREAVRLMLDCDAIHLLDGWVNSTGAQAEYALSTMLGMTVIP